LAREPHPAIMKAIDMLRSKNPKASDAEIRALFVQLCHEDEAFAKIVADDWEG